jgi:superfamily II DNA or RNA helicase
VREPLDWKLASRQPAHVDEVLRDLAEASQGTSLDHWTPPSWLLEHQTTAAKRIVGAIAAFGGALLADGVGLGKTYVALAVATRFRRTTVVAPACILAQWERTSARLGRSPTLVSHEGLSRSGRVPVSDLVVIDEAHRFRNPATQRYDRLARDLGRARVLLVTATPVVNHARDLVHILRLFLPDGALSFLGIRSLERAGEAGDDRALAAAISRFTVARPVTMVTRHGSTLPAVVEAAVERPPVAVEHRIADYASVVAELTFPGAPTATCHLLRSHLLHRLASSLSAFRGTVIRHLAYADRALASSGERIPARQVLRQILGPGDDLQFELWGTLGDVSPTHDTRGALLRERSLLLDLLRTIDLRVSSPKPDRLAALLSSHPGKTLVFTASRETALELAGRLTWHRLAVVAAGRGRLASGPAGIQRILDLFAPRARHTAHAAPERIRIDTLIATDLVSEGLDLQDADTVVHYDLPWTPVRLAQRLGRTVRLGSCRPSVRVLWFAPPPILERQLQLERRLARKAEVQLSLTVPATSRIGRAQIFSQSAAARESLCLEAGAPRPARRNAPTRCAVVAAAPSLVAAVRWRLSGGDVGELLAVGPRPPHIIAHPPHVLEVVTDLRHGVAVDAEIPTATRRALIRILRSRLRMCQIRVVGAEGRRLRRQVLRLGVAAGRQRNVECLTLLDRVLERLQLGCAVGAERRLASALSGGATVDALRTWLRDTPAGCRTAPRVQVVAVLAGTSAHGVAASSSSISSPASAISSSS